MFLRVSNEDWKAIGIAVFIGAVTALVVTILFVAFIIND